MVKRSGYIILFEILLKVFGYFFLFWWFNVYYFVLVLVLYCVILSVLIRGKDGLNLLLDEKKSFFLFVLVGKVR